MANLATPDLIEAWIGNFQGTREEAIEHLRKVTVIPGQLRHTAQVRAWLAEQERQGQIAKDTIEHDFMRRQTVAAEVSAEAAGRSARWAIYSAVIACVALLVSIWPYFRLVGALERFLK
ncbi:hypothetical protein [Rhizobacter sp. Root404]|uniref:hypothetical protein n=1 Tax=Rhizobacter sp. Root404 TaxID=1736528 RepID=UPI0006F80521|nr:hypothetical protein [Rhizobacter sp. Root404]KQW36512.1 hypothetical protein ASC76_17760 [Rhizobacter sp. Root404]